MIDVVGPERQVGMTDAPQCSFTEPVTQDRRSIIWC